MFWQTACASQGLPRHSLMSVHVVPFPVNPGLHAQLNDPSKFEQVAFALQPPLFVAHSFTSAHVVPLPE